jgi:hypothetical protein
MLGACSSSAANLASSYNGGGAIDWFLPSAAELVELYNQSAVVGGFASSKYWSSSEVSNFYVWSVSFSNGSMYNDDAKTNTPYVRPIRAF